MPDPSEETERQTFTQQGKSMPEEPKKNGSIYAMVLGGICAGLGAFGGCTMQLVHDLGGEHGGPPYFLYGILIGAVIGFLGWAMLRERDR